MDSKLFLAVVSVMPYGYGYAQPAPSYGLFGSSWGQPQRVVVYRSNGSQAPAGYRVR